MRSRLRGPYGNIPCVNEPGQPTKSNRFFARVSLVSDAISRVLSWLSDVLARALVIVITLFVGATAWSLVFGQDDPAWSRTGKILSLLNDNWKVLLILIVPLFYQTVRGLLERSHLAFPWIQGSRSGERAPTSPTTPRQLPLQDGNDRDQ